MANYKEQSILLSFFIFIFYLSPVIFLPNPWNIFAAYGRFNSSTDAHNTFTSCTPLESKDQALTAVQSDTNMIMRGPVNS